MCKRCAYALKTESGQALVEAPVVITIVCWLALLLLQPVVTLSTKMMLGNVAASLVRIACADANYGTGNHQSLVYAYVSDKLLALPRGSAFQVPGSLLVEVDGAPSSEIVSVKVSVRQKPLPLIGWLAPQNNQGEVVVSAKASGPGALAGVVGNPMDAPVTYGNSE